VCKRSLNHHKQPYQEEEEEEEELDGVGPSSIDLDSDGGDWSWLNAKPAAAGLKIYYISSVSFFCPHSGVRTGPDSRKTQVGDFLVNENLHPSPHLDALTNPYQQYVSHC
jgi:hypothetical protein